MAEIKQTDRVASLLAKTFDCSKQFRHEFMLPEHMLYVLKDDATFKYAFEIFCSLQELTERLEAVLRSIECVPEGVECKGIASEQLVAVVKSAMADVAHSNAEALDIPHLVRGILQLEESWAAYILKDCLYKKETNFLSRLISFYETDDRLEQMKAARGEEPHYEESPAAWRMLVTCMNEHYREHNPLIGREAELRRTMQVLCRCDKNNPLHVGEPGVGKTALVWGLARLMEEGNVPPRLLQSRIYQLDMGTLMAGTQYRGDFEERLKMIMEGIQNESKYNIVYIDEIHTLVGAGATNESSLDASNLLKPYLESGNLRFIGSTTYEEYNKYFARSKGLVRRFQQIDIAEPSPLETVDIITQLLPRYEAYHGVSYDTEAVRFAVEASARHITDRYLPDKAIDLIDEAGAAMEMREETARIGKKEIADVLSKVCKVDALTVADDADYKRLKTLSSRMQSQIFGQDAAIRQVVEAVQMSRAGLLDDGKPLASLLFVGPTGVGKTEVARVLAKELGIALLRFDMSEYAEKHTVAKLIGSPAGYVGYEDGGLLTDAIRKTPNAVLLLDEIEKAHQDIYNVLLQVMDYARLTDNKGRQADFRHVVLIMTSNAGAQYASQRIGFSGEAHRGETMMKAIKKTFKPEFLNRLSGAVVFRDMDREMATLILKKKLKELNLKLEAKNVKMTLRKAAFDYLLREGYTPEYGAREMDRVVSQQLKPLLMREILFGKLRKGGTITIGVKDGSLSVR
ncbi:MAG: AAA family ATPase [Alloprevotella sp.]|nr:AAA family ATPase [Alloprevotella sp.]